MAVKINLECCYKAELVEDQDIKRRNHKFIGLFHSSGIYFIQYLLFRSKYSFQKRM